MLFSESDGDFLETTFTGVKYVSAIGNLMEGLVCTKGDKPQ